MAEEPLTLPDRVPGELTRITREDGTQRVASSDMPLYSSAGDTAAGDTNGQGVGDVWFVVTPAPAGFQIATPIGSPAASPVVSRGSRTDGPHSLNGYAIAYEQPHRAAAPSSRTGQPHRAAAPRGDTGWIGRPDPPGARPKPQVGASPFPRTRRA